MRARCKARFVTSKPSPAQPCPATATAKDPSGQSIQPSLRAFHSFFGSKFKAPKTPPSHGFRGLAAIKAVAESGEGLRGVAGSGKPAQEQFAAGLLRPEIHSEMDCGRGAKPASSRPSPAPAPTTAKATAKSPSRPAQSSLAFAPFAPFLRANSRPRKRLHRTVSGAWLLSKR